MEKKFQYLESEIFYKEIGEGMPVVFLHGFAEDSNIWEEQTNFLQNFCRLIIPDLPGSGKSVLIKKDNVGMEDYAACINTLLASEGTKKCILLGHSMGGYIALAFAEKFAEKLLGFGLVHSTAFADSEEKKSNRIKGIRVMEEYGVYPFLKNTTPNLFSSDYKNNHPERVEELIERGKNYSIEALTGYYTAMINRPDRTEVLAKSKVPVLFVIGSEDTAAPVNDLLKQVYLPAISHIHIIKGVGHMSMLETPDQLNTYLLEFINSAPRPEGS